MKIPSYAHRSVPGNSGGWALYSWRGPHGGLHIQNFVAAHGEPTDHSCGSHCEHLRNSERGGWVAPEDFYPRNGGESSTVEPRNLLDGGDTPIRRPRRTTKKLPSE